ncbi:3270_t:CDS:2 [Dentiscutata heterogama]|uniref:3270_t:CDS:1 n=1 Tax=Dentiscutata heterogama TaxID=1316150 RepID=A0ACA9N4J4_9GLOM|nr:3270_t:CDS:2 [Dentiscutata heterogama]
MPNTLQEAVERTQAGEMMLARSLTMFGSITMFIMVTNTEVAPSAVAPNSASSDATSSDPVSSTTKNLVEQGVSSAVINRPNQLPLFRLGMMKRVVTRQKQEDERPKDNKHEIPSRRVEGRCNKNNKNKEALKKDTPDDRAIMNDSEETSEVYLTLNVSSKWYRD